MSTKQSGCCSSRGPVRRAASVLVLIAAGLGMAGCDRGPTMDELGPRFEQDALAIIHYLADSYAEPSGEFAVVTDGSVDIDCFGDKRQRKFEATFRMRDGDPDDNLDFFTYTIRAAFTAFGPRNSDHPDYYTDESDYYTLEENGVADDFGSERTFSATNDDETITFEVRATGHPDSTVVLSGETACIEP